MPRNTAIMPNERSEEHTSELQSQSNLVCRLLLEKKKEDHRAPTVVHQVWYRAGSMDEPPGTTGVAHVLEHMLCKGTRRFGLGEFSRIVAAAGGVATPGYQHGCATATAGIAGFADVTRHKRLAWSPRHYSPLAAKPIPAPKTLAQPLQPGLTRFFFNATATPEIYTLSLHDALPI